MKKRIQRVLACLLLCACLAAHLPPAGAAAGFADVPAGSWAAESISRCVELGLFQGETATRFGAGHPMTRAAFVVVLGRLFSWQAVTPAAGSFSDNRDPSAWYYAAVETAYANGAVTHQSEDFRPNDPITREEMAVMLVRALGYGTIAGLAQDLPIPFTDVTANAGYIAMAYELGIVSGTSATAFSPERTATREQAAVMLMRIYDKCHAPSPGRVGVASSPEGLGDLAGCDAVGVTAARLIYNGQPQVNFSMEERRSTAIRDAVRASGASALLYVTGNAASLKGTALATAAALAEAVTRGGYDGLFLDLPKMAAEQRKSVAALAAALRKALGDRPLYLMAEAPAWHGKTYAGYDYAALADQADRLVLRVAPYERTAGEFPTAPLEPLEEVYYALSQMNGVVPAEKLSLLLTTTGSVFTNGKRSAPMSANRVAELLADAATEDYYSIRYGCAYLTQPAGNGQTVVWYLNGEAAAARLRLAAFFGVGQVCLSDLTSVSPEVSGALQTGQ